MQVLADNPVLLIEQGAPHRIHDDEQLARYTDALFRLTSRGTSTTAERETIDLLTLLIEEYEAKYQLPKADAITVLRYLMEKGGLLQQDLRPELGSLSSVSMILSGQRKLTLKNAYALADRFGVDIRVFLPMATGGKVSPGTAKTLHPPVKRMETRSKVAAKKRPSAKVGAFVAGR